MDPDYDSDNYERALVRQEHPKADTAVLKALIQNALADRIASKKRSAELTFDSSSPGHIQRQSQ